MLDIKLIGPGLEKGPLPAVVYFALSAHDSLYTDPFNQPVLSLQSPTIRIFSITLPYHLEYPAETVLQIWADQLSQGSRFIEDFLHEVTDYLQNLLHKNMILPHQFGVMGLSRGVWVATQVMSRLKEIRSLLGFAPMTTLQTLKEFKSLKSVLEPFDLVHTIDHLLKRPIRWYIGNHDTRVSTSACFDFILKLAEATYPHHRSPPVELLITPSLGRDGHGTSPQIFHQGALWLKEQLQV